MSHMQTSLLAYWTGCTCCTSTLVYFILPPMILCTVQGPLEVLKGIPL